MECMGWDDIRGVVFAFDILQWNYDHKLGPKPWLWCDRHFRWKVRLCSQSSLCCCTETEQLSPSATNQYGGFLRFIIMYVYGRYWYFCIFFSKYQKNRNFSFLVIYLSYHFFTFQWKLCSKIFIFTKNNYYPSYFHVNWHMICSSYCFFSS